MVKKLLRYFAACVCALAGAAVLLPLLYGERCAMGMWAAFPLLFLAYAAAFGMPGQLKAPWCRLWKTLAVLCAVWLGCSILLFAAMASLSFAPLPDEAAAILVPGCLVTEAGLSPMLQRRCDAALALSAQYPDAVVIVSGGQGRAEPQTEAGAMRRYLAAQGLDEARIRVDETALSTAENLSAAAQILQREGITGTLLIVSDDFHLLRIAYFAKRHGLDAALTACSRSGAMSLCYWFREQ
ncbi:MAG: YdcF family protein, partial [Oscillospiraceae bacterium]|nr:YdcF family protein [Oscillospiraceae bacterium]